MRLVNLLTVNRVNFVQTKNQLANPLFLTQLCCNIIDDYGLEIVFSLSYLIFIFIFMPFVPRLNVLSPYKSSRILLEERFLFYHPLLIQFPILIYPLPPSYYPSKFGVVPLLSFKYYLSLGLFTFPSCTMYSAMSLTRLIIVSFLEYTIIANTA